MVPFDPRTEGAEIVRRSPSVQWSVSVVIPVRNEERYIRHTLEQVFSFAEDGIELEVIVVDGESTDATRDIVREMMSSHANLRLLANPKRISSAARNLGIAHCRGDLIVIIDGHCELENPHYFKDLVDAFARSEADCLGRPQPLDVSRATNFQRAVAAARGSWLGHHPDSHIYASQERFVHPQSVAVAYRRSVFERVGLFDESFDACEDVELNHRVDRAGMSCFFTPKIRARYHPRTSPTRLFQQMVRYGRGRIRLLRKHPDTFSLPSLVPMFFVAGLAFGPLAAWASAWLAFVYVTILALYASAVLIASIEIALRPGQLLLLPWLLVTFPTIHLGAGIGELNELASGLQLPRDLRCYVERLS